MRVNDSEMIMRWNNETWSVPKISVHISPETRWIQTEAEKNTERDGFLTF